VRRTKDLFNDQDCGRHGWWLLLAVTLLLYLPGTDVLPLMDRDEPRFAHAAVEMMERGTWTVPWFNGEYRFDKPPLTYWWMRLHYRLLGVTELGARLHGIVAAYAIALVMAGLARRVTGSHRAGMVGGLLWLTTAQVLIHGRLCVADMPMVLCVTLACRALMELLIFSDPASRSSGWWWTLWLSLGFGFLAKGPIALLVPGLSLALWRLVFWRKPVPLGRLRPLPGVLVMLAPVVAWGVPALVETKGAFWQVGMGRHVVQRGMEVLNGRRFIPGYYLLTTWVSLFPWLFMVVPVWRAIRARWTAESAFLIAWFLAPQIIFFLYATQLPHYVMPGYPAFLILLAMTWTCRRADERPRFPAICISGTAFLGGLALLILGCAWLFPITNEPLRDLVRAAGLTLTVLLLGGGTVATVVWAGRGMPAVALALAMMVSLSVSVASLAQSLRQTSVTIQCAEGLRSMPAGTRCLGCGYDEPSLVHYTAFKWEMGGNAATARAFLERAGPCAVVLLRREWTLDSWIKSLTGARRPGTPAKDFQTEVDGIVTSSPGLESQVIEGFNGARSSWSEVVLLVRRR
jgi:4-amino-4-deoxy-L-arabinose transferase-like glycosyltransferase